MKFENLIGQRAIKDQLVNMVQQNRLSHALLFLGKEGSGALPLALAFAQYIVCISSKSIKTEPALFEEILSPPTGEAGRGLDSCGSCPACLKANKLIHPDIHFSFPVI